ncbi:type II secretion system protein [Mariniblastus fucicola]|uniref:Type II secretion system protein G n=1 Tax=Mariniblastus fucicola TaxID=980251 RepID=A0A5B9P610_9BACT|nr:type II secretion system protein [Mariniblastus fucicola]QEG20615.1 hypothetical protein MFFC18_04650 [Mariniblastus fucicola]
MNKYSSIRQPRTRRSAFTLVELLLVIAIIAILASLGVGVMAQAQNDAAISASRSRMTLVQQILEIELENYEVKRSPVSFATMVSMINSSPGLEPDRLLLHVKNLKRMFMADLIRAEMPDGSVTGGRNIGDFPTVALAEYFRNQLNIEVNSYSETQQSNRPQSVVEWETWASNSDYLGGAPPTPANWPPVRDGNAQDGIVEDAALRSEMLFEILSRIDIDGVPATETLGPQAIADTNGNGHNEIVDGWGEPLYLQWQQVIMSGDPEEGIWSETPSSTGQSMCGLSCEHFNGNPSVSVTDYVTPVLPTQIRPFLTSERMLNIDGYPSDSVQRALN